MVKFTFKGYFGSSDKWEMRWFHFTANTMEFSKREQHVILVKFSLWKSNSTFFSDCRLNFSQGYFPLAGATVKEETTDESSFTITSAATGLLNLKADTPDERAAWVDYISKEISMFSFW